MKSYFGVVFLNNGDACICSACKSEEEVREELAKAIKKNPGKVKATTFMVREEDDLMKILGHPKSRDLMQDKKFLRSITA